MLRLFFGRQLGIDACRQLLLDARLRAQRQLAEFDGIRREMTSEPQYAADHPYWLLTVTAGEHSARAAIHWADESLAVVNALAPAAREST